MKTPGSNNAPKGLTKEQEEEELESVVMIWSPGKARDFSAVEFCKKKQYYISVFMTMYLYIVHV